MGEQLPHALGAAPYCLTVASHLDAAWADWFGDCTITAQPNGITLIEIEQADQAMLYGLLARARDLGLTLISLQRVVCGAHQSRP